MALSLAHLRNITVFMRYAAEAGKLQSINDVMGFAETMQAVNAEGARLQKLEDAKQPKKPEGDPK